MKIGIYVHGYQPNSGGGYTFEKEILETLMNFIPQSHHEFSIFTSNSTLDVTNLLAKTSKIKFINLKGNRRFITRLLRKIMILDDWKLRNPSDLNYCAKKIGVEFLWFITPSYQRVNIPYIAIVWDLQHRLQPWFPEVGTYNEWLLRERSNSDFIQRATFVLTGTKTGKEEISFFYQIPKERIRVLPLPPPRIADKFKENQVQMVLEKYKLTSGFLFYPSQFWPHKNHANLLNALKILNIKYNISFDLVLVGSDKGNEEYIRKLAIKLGIEKRVHFLGFVSKEELISLYQSAFVLTFVSFFGPDNIPPLEAFRIGCPVIASDVPGSEEQLGDAALLVDPSNPNAIADAVKLLIDDPRKRLDLIEHGKKIVNNWTSDDYVRSVLKIFDEFENIRVTWG